MESDRCAFGMHDVCQGYIDLSADLSGYCTCACHGGIRQPAVVEPPELPPGISWLPEPRERSDRPVLTLTL